MVALLFPYLILKTLHWRPIGLGFVYTAAAIGTGICALGIGILADVWGRKATFLMSSLLLPVSILMIVLSSNTWVIFIAAIIGGFSGTGSLAGGGIGGAIQPIQSAVVRDISPSDKRTHMFSLLAFTGGISAACGMALTRFFSIEHGFMVALVFSLLATIPVLGLKLESPRGTLKKIKSKVVIGKFSLTGIFNGMSQGMVNPFMIPFFVLVYHMPKERMATWGFVAGVVAAVTLLFAPTLERRMGFVKTIAVTRGAGAILLVLFPFVRVLPFSIFVYLASRALRVVGVPVQQTALTDRVQGDEYGRSLAINQVARLVASAAGSAMSGLFFNADILAAPFLIYGAITSFNIGLYVRFFSNEPK